MFQLLVIVLAISVFVVFSTFVVWLSLADAGKRIWADRCDATSGNSLFLRGTELFYWAQDTAAGIVAKFLNRSPTKDTPIELARELHAVTTCAMVPLGAASDELDTIPCPENGQGMIGVTAPEALEIADHIQRNLSRRDKNRIRRRAQRNLSRFAKSNIADFDASQTPCPLQGNNGICLAYPARPLRCRPFHAAEIWRERGLKQSVDAEHDSDEQIVEQGAEAGVTEALRSAGRDGNLYELNSALVIALETPNAAGRWAKGEEIFADCKRCL